MGRKRQKNVRAFTVDFTINDEKDSALTVPCPYYSCKAKVGHPCTVPQARWDHEKGEFIKLPARSLSDPHHDRFAVSIGLKVKQSSSVYIIDLDSFARRFPVTYEQAERISVLWAERAAELAKKT